MAADVVDAEVTAMFVEISGKLGAVVEAVDRIEENGATAEDVKRVEDLARATNGSVATAHREIAALKRRNEISDDREKQRAATVAKRSTWKLAAFVGALGCFGAVIAVVVGHFL